MFKFGGLRAKFVQKLRLWRLKFPIFSQWGSLVNWLFSSFDWNWTLVNYRKGLRGSSGTHIHLPISRSVPPRLVSLISYLIKCPNFSVLCYSAVCEWGTKYLCASSNKISGDRHFYSYLGSLIPREVKRMNQEVKKVNHVSVWPSCNAMALATILTVTHGRVSCCSFALFWHEQHKLPLPCIYRRTVV